jgi:hypothetical protein
VPLPPGFDGHGHGHGHGHGRDDDHHDSRHEGRDHDRSRHDDRHASALSLIGQRDLDDAWRAWQRHGGQASGAPSPIDYAVGWARLRDFLAGRHGHGGWDDGGCGTPCGSDWRHFAGSGNDPCRAGGRDAFGLMGDRLKGFDGLREGFERLR